MTCRAETAEAQMMKTGDFNAAPAKEDWGGEEGVQDWSADGAPAPAAAAPAAISAPASGYQVRNSLKYFHILKYFLSPGDRGLVRPDRDQRLGCPDCPNRASSSCSDLVKNISKYFLVL